MKRLMRQFDLTWDHLNSTGEVSARPGAEYWRVRQEWAAADRPFTMLEFIRAHADKGGLFR